MGKFNLIAGLIGFGLFCHVRDPGPDADCQKTHRKS